MGTPSSKRRFAQSQTKVSWNNNPSSVSEKSEGTEKVLSRRKNNKSDETVGPLAEVTNDSPIVGLAMNNLETPSTLIMKKIKPKMAPGSGESLLRRQVKTLLQKVQDDADLSKLAFEHRFDLGLQGILLNSSSGLLALTPANTPHAPNFSCNGGFDITPNHPTSTTTAFELEEGSKASKDVMITEGLKQETLELEKMPSTPLILLSISEEPEISGSSSYSTMTIEQESKLRVYRHVQEDDEEGDYTEEEGALVDELCTGLSKVRIQEKRMPEFLGKHIRFLYNSDDEIEGQEEVTESSPVSPSILRLKGIPAPQGKHLRFPDEEDD
ncbi:PREDICTED: uncharacterized protein LOC104605573 [Nelumbo nucifera]|uniref:Uncharacterized protein n=2 Tax=Nelumbo nucifera TaxID=4432 RepID=A0A822XPX2_NELNU|nr:PREDICTED: uncharacterized protein LOC104605573 [Nelumbo nucifera]DAD22377.1 TPA_asm: hypothetical protein HUJ06_023840 [Nelumbo nucifera]